MSVSDSSSSNCGVCDDEVSSKHKALECDLCGKWIHIKCTNVNEKAYKLIREINSCNCSSMKWFCPKCDGVASQVLVSLKSVLEKQTKLEKLFEDSEKSVTELKSKAESREKHVDKALSELKAKVDKIDKNVGDLTSKNIPAILKDVNTLNQSYADITANSSASSLPNHLLNVNSEIDKKVKLEMAEVIQREKKKCNLIVVGVNENGTSSKDLYRDEIKKIFGDAGVPDSVEFEVVGKVGITTSENTVMVRICVNDHLHRGNVLKVAKNLKNVTNRQKVYIMPDLTKKQQDQGKKLRLKLKDIRNAGERFAKIQNNEIIKIENGTRTVLFSGDV